MPRPRCLPTLPYRPYYFFRTAASGRTLIADRAERRAFARILTATLAKSGIHLHFAHVDATEIHLGLYSGEGSISTVLGHFCQRYARAINRLRHESGSLFRPHAHLLLVQQGKSFLQLGRYIHWIPRLRSNDTARGRFTWNTDTFYRSRRSIRGLVTSPTFRALAKRSGVPRVQDDAYRAFFDQRPTPQDIQRFRRGSAEDPRIVGDPEFVREIARQLGLPLNPGAPRDLNSQEALRRTLQTLLEEFRVLCDKHLPEEQARRWQRVATLESVCSKSRTQPLPMIRGLGAAYALTQRIATLRQTEQFFRCRPGTLSAPRRQRYAQTFQDHFRRPYEQLLLTKPQQAQIATHRPSKSLPHLSGNP
jgi:hypothetical protein